MQRKSLLFVLIAVLAALLLFTGCPTDGGDDGPGTSGSEDTTGGGGGGGGGGDTKVTETVGASVSVEQLEIWASEGKTIVFAKTVTLSTDGLTTVDLGTAKITVNEDVEVTFPTGVVTINATKADVVFEAGSKFTFTEDDGVYLAGANAKIELKNIDGTDSVIAVWGSSESLGIGSPNISVGSLTGADLAKVGNTQAVYVMGDLTITEDITTTSTGKVVVYGNVKVSTEDVDLSSLTSLDLSAATLTNTEEAEIKFPSTLAAIGTVKPGSDKLTLSGGAASTTVTLLDLNAAGSIVDFNGDATTLTITEAKGAGTAEFSGSGYAAVTLEAGTLKIGAGGLATTTTGAIKLGPTATTATFTAANAAIAFPANTELDAELKTVTLGGELAMTGTGTLTLGNTAILKTGTGTLKTTTGAITVGTSGGTFTPGAAITFPAGTEFAGESKTITLGGDLALGTASLTINASGVLDLKGKGLTTGATGGVILTSGKVISSEAGSVITAGAASIVLGTNTDSVTLTSGTFTLNGGTITEAGVVSLVADDSIALVDGGTFVVAASGKVSLPNTEFGVGTYKADGALTITAGSTGGDTIVTAPTADKGLILGSGNTALSLLTQDTTPAIYTFTKASSGKGVVFGNTTTAITVGNGTTPEASGIAASAKAKIVLGTAGNATDAINLGNGATLKLAVGATISEFTSSPATLGPNKTGASLGGALLTKDTASLNNSSGTLTGTTAEATLTGAATGDSSIAAAAAFVEGTP